MISGKEIEDILNESGVWDEETRNTLGEAIHQANREVLREKAERRITPFIGELVDM